MSVQKTGQTETTNKCVNNKNNYIKNHKCQHTEWAVTHNQNSYKQMEVNRKIAGTVDTCKAHSDE